MSSKFRPAPFLIVDAPKGWAFYQKEQRKIARAWVRDPGSATRFLEKEAAEKEISKNKNAIEIPPHWKALPTGFDLQVHLRFPGQSQKETLLGGIESALLGGYDTVLTMPNTSPFLDQPEILRSAIEGVRQADIPIRIAFTASATKGMLGAEATDIPALAKAGAAAITDDGWGVKTEAAQCAVFEACEEAQILFQQHAEMPGHKGVAPKSAFQARENLPEYPRSAEADMVRRDISLLRKYPKARYHVLHVSTRETLSEIRRGKAEGLQITAEVTPHHLLFSNRDIPSANDPRCTYFKMNPPLFDPEDQLALQAALQEGTIDCVSTDHAPHEFELKAKGWLLAPFGTRGMETALPALLTLVHRGVLSWDRMVEVFSLAPRRILNRPEYMEPTGLLFVDPSKKYEITEEELPGTSMNSCFLGATLHGRVELRCEDKRFFQRKS